MPVMNDEQSSKRHPATGLTVPDMNSLQQASSVNGPPTAPSIQDSIRSLIILISAHGSIKIRKSLQNIQSGVHLATAVNGGVQLIVFSQIPDFKVIVHFGMQGKGKDNRETVQDGLVILEHRECSSSLAHDAREFYSSKPQWYKYSWGEWPGVPDVTRKMQSDPSKEKATCLFRTMSR